MGGVVANATYAHILATQKDDVELLGRFGEECHKDAANATHIASETACAF